MVFFEKHEISEMTSGDNQFIENPISLPPPVLQIQSCLEFKLIKMSAVITSGA